VSRAALLPTDHRTFAAASSLSTPRADAERRTIPRGKCQRCVSGGAAGRHSPNPVHATASGSY